MAPCYATVLISSGISLNLHNTAYWIYHKYLMKTTDTPQKNMKAAEEF